MIRPVGGASPATQAQGTPAREIAGGGFDNSLDALLARSTAEAEKDAREVNFSRHASARMRSRGVELPSEDLESLKIAFDKLENRGARESLVLLGDNAFVVGVPSRTVITTMTRSEAAGNVFTQIDSTVVIR